VNPEPVQEAIVAPVVQVQLELLQHTPVQGEGVQVLVGPWYISPPAHPVTVTAAHTQVDMLQHTPGHGVEQVPLQVKMLGEVQVPRAVTAHAPDVLLQHLPMQGVGLQVPAQ
jgi:hypothetical protein